MAEDDSCCTGLNGVGNYHIRRKFWQFYFKIFVGTYRGWGQLALYYTHNLRTLTNQIHHDWPSKQHRQEDQYPGEVWSLEGKQTKEVEPDIRVSPTPDIHKHGGECFTKEYHAYEKGSNTLCQGSQGTHHWTQRNPSLVVIPWNQMCSLKWLN